MKSDNQIYQKIKLKKNPIIFKNSFISLQIINNVNKKNIPYFFFRSNSITLNRSKEVIKFFSKLNWFWKTNKNIYSKLILTNSNNFITNPNYLLDFRNQFFNKELSIVGYFCWPWFFDITDNDTIFGKNKFLKNVIDKGVKSTIIPKNNSSSKKNLKFYKSILKFFYRTKLLKPRSRNLKKFTKILLSLSSSNLKQILINKSLIKNILFKSQPKNWDIVLNNFVNKENIIKTKNNNSYLFLNNKLSQFSKPIKYHVESYLYSKNINFYNKYSQRSKTLRIIVNIKKKLPQIINYSSTFFLNEINSFIKKNYFNTFTKSLYVNNQLRILNMSYLNFIKPYKNFFFKKKSRIKNRNNINQKYKKKLFINKVLKKTLLHKFLLKKNLFLLLQNKFNSKLLKFKNQVRSYSPNFCRIQKLYKKKYSRYQNMNLAFKINKTVSVKTVALVKIRRHKILKKNKKHKKIFRKHKKIFKISLRNFRFIVKKLFKKKKKKRSSIYYRFNFLIKFMAFKLRKRSTWRPKRNRRLRRFIKWKLKLLNQRKLKKRFLYIKFFSKNFFYKNLLKKRFYNSQVFLPEYNVQNMKYTKNLTFIDINKNFLQKFINIFFKKTYLVAPYKFAKNNFVINKSIKLKSRTKKSLVFRNIGMFIWAQKKSFFKKFDRMKFMFKKKIYSFLFPNEVKKAIMDRRKSFKSYRFIYNTSNFKNKKAYYSLVYFKNNYKNFFKVDSLNKAYKNFNTWSSYSNYKFLLKSITREEVLYEDDFQNRGHLTIFQNKELFLKRIRFKPGYQRIWRQAREAALEHFNKRTVYQQQLTKYLSKFYRQAHYSAFLYSETTLGRTIVYSQLLPDYPTIEFFKNKNFIFLNGKVLPDLNIQVVPTDFIQLVISNWFYIYNRWITNNTLIRARKFKRLIYRKGMASKYKVVKLRKQKSRYTPKWIHYSRFDHSDIRTYFEVDFLTMSMMVIYNPYILDYYAPDSTIDLRISIYKMYNWKYIT